MGDAEQAQPRSASRVDAGGASGRNVGGYQSAAGQQRDDRAEHAAAVSAHPKTRLTIIHLLADAKEQVVLAQVPFCACARPETVTHVSGMNCYLCLRNRPPKGMASPTETALLGLTSILAVPHGSHAYLLRPTALRHSWCAFTTMFCSLCDRVPLGYVSAKPL